MFLSPFLFALESEREVTQYAHEHWGAAEGLPHYAVMDITQGPRGYLWLATYGGLVRFDGVSFYVFNKTNTPDLDTNGIFAVETDSTGGLWIGTNGGGVLCYKDDRFKVYRKVDGLADNYINALKVDHLDRVWVGTRGGLSLIQNGTVRSFHIADGLADELVGMIDVDHSGKVWFITRKGIQFFSGGQFGKLEHPQLEGRSVYTLYSDPRDGSLWIGLRRPGVLHLAADGKTRLYTTEDGLRDDDIAAILRDRDGNLWVGSALGGVARLQNGRFQSFTSEHGLSNNAIRALFEDREGSLWIGTYRGGLNRLRNGKMTMISTLEGLSMNMIRPVFVDSRDRVWVGTVGGGVNVIEGDSIRIYTKEDGLTENRVWSIAEDPQGGIWLGTYGGGINFLKDGKVTVIGVEQGLPDPTVRALYMARDGRLWAGTNGGGVVVIENGRIVANYTTSDGLPSNFVFCVFEDSHGVIWAGTYSGGLGKFEGGRWQKYDPDNGLSSDFVWSATEDNEGNVWFGTNNGGMMRYRDGVFTAFTAKQGLPDDDVFGVLPTPDGTLWLSTNSGLASVTLADLAAYEAGSLERIPFEVPVEPGDNVGYCNGPSFPPSARDSRGRLWFPTTKGVMMMEPHAVKRNQLVPPVVIEALHAEGKEVAVNGEIIFKPGTTNFAIDFTALSLAEPEKVRFRYQLEGMDTEWTEVVNRRSAYYHQLNPGIYTFRVIACNNDGVWNEEGASLSFELKPHFYETTWFYALVAFSIFLLGAMAAYLRIRSYKERERRLAAIVAERTRQLHDANEELARLANSDALTGISNRRFFMNFLEKEWSRCMRSGAPLSLIMIDVDFFKKYNDRYGHGEGDQCLRRVAQALNETVGRPTDLVARYGGEEFVAGLAETNLADAVKVAERMRLRIVAEHILHEHHPEGHVTASLGVAALVPDNEHDIEDLLVTADEALYEAKAQGRNRVVGADPTIVRERDTPTN